MLIMIFSIFLNPAQAIKLKEKFKYCQVYDNQMILDLTETCVESTFRPEFKSIAMHILNQRTNKISGIAKQCKKLKI